MSIRTIATIAAVWLVGGGFSSAAAADLGVPREEDFPSYRERAVLYLTNRARAEPSAYDEPQTYEPSPPIRWDRKLSKAARWQARHVVEADCWCRDHSSCCELEEADGDVQCADPPSSCGGTPAGARVARWSAAYSGENAAQGYDTPSQAVDGWIHSSGHWRNINQPHHTRLGVGYHRDIWVQDFGRDDSPRPVAGDGIHLPANESGQVRFGITYYQPGTGGPQSAQVVVDGECHELDLVRGEADHGAFEMSLDLPPGCHRYYFHVTDGRGNHHTYPGRGSLGVSGDDESCSLYRSNRPADTCSPTGQPCETGDTRTCYTGPYETEGVGICEVGSERCIGGEWQGTCRLQTRPRSRDRCGNDRDDDCDGSVDEKCRNRNDADASSTGADASRAGGDTGRLMELDDHSGTSGCTQSHRGSPLSGSGLVLSVVFALARGVRQLSRA